jgi:hypothetical protein
MYMDIETTKGKDNPEKKKFMPPNMNEQVNYPLTPNKKGNPTLRKITNFAIRIFSDKGGIGERGSEGKFYKKRFCREHFKTRYNIQYIYYIDKERVSGIFDFLVTHNFILEK